VVVRLPCGECGAENWREYEDYLSLASRRQHSYTLPPPNVCFMQLTCITAIASSRGLKLPTPVPFAGTSFPQTIQNTSERGWSECGAGSPASTLTSCSGFRSRSCRA
jgi:hypothetical protein